MHVHISIDPSGYVAAPSMRDHLSLFLLKNALGAKMKKGLRNFCNDDGSTSTLNQRRRHKTTSCSPPRVASLAAPAPAAGLGHGDREYDDDDDVDADDHKIPVVPPTLTLEEMILKLDLEEEIARSKSNQNDQLMMINSNNYVYNGILMRPGRMSCVNNSDILRSARNALNQYPRFSLDGKDAMYRSSFRNNSSGSAHNDPHLGLRRPATLAGESVVWCKPGVVAKLMGLDAIPLPLRTTTTTTSRSRSDMLAARGGTGCIINMKTSRRKRNLMIKKISSADHDHQLIETSRSRFVMDHIMDGTTTTPTNNICDCRFNNMIKGKTTC